MRRRLSVLATLSFAVFALAACGGGDDKPAEPGVAPPVVKPADLPANGVEKFKASTILSKSREAAKKAGSVRVKRTSGSGSNRSVLDATVSADTGIAKITGRGSAFEVRRVDGSLYYHGDEATAARSIGAEAAKLLGGRWFVVPEKDEKVAEFTRSLTFNDVIAEALAPAEVTKGETVTYLGQPAIRLSDKSRNIYIALRGEPLLLGVEHRSSRDKTTFTGWGAPVRVNPPPGDPIRVNDLAEEKPAG